MIAIGSDHAGYHLKNVIVEYLGKKGIPVKDFGTDSLESVDFSDFAKKVGEAVSGKSCDKGIVICGTGIGVSIAVNKLPGVRGALCTNEYMARMSRRHNNANVLALGERVLGEELAKQIVDVFLQEDFEGGRHEKRVLKLSNLEKNRGSDDKDE